MDLIAELRRQARRYRCAVCSENMAECDIQVLEQRENVALVQVTCASCQEESLFQIIFRSAPSVPGPPSRRRIEEAPAAAGPIGSDDLLDAHLLLQRHRGGLKELLSPS